MAKAKGVRPSSSRAFGLGTRVEQRGGNVRSLVELGREVQRSRAVVISRVRFGPCLEQRGGDHGIRVIAGRDGQSGVANRVSRFQICASLEQRDGDGRVLVVSHCQMQRSIVTKLAPRVGVDTGLQELPYPFGCCAPEPTAACSSHRTWKWVQSWHGWQSPLGCFRRLWSSKVFHPRPLLCPRSQRSLAPSSFRRFCAWYASRPRPASSPATTQHRAGTPHRHSPFGVPTTRPPDPACSPAPKGAVAPPRTVGA